MNVLVVDDQRTMRMISVSVLHSMGHRTVEAADGTEAIEACNQELFDLILMDVEMPGLSGFETAITIRERRPQWFPIIFISAKTDPRFFVEGIKSGGDIYLFKPVIPEVLASMVKAMARIASYQQELHETKVRMEVLANRDQLTGLVNRRGFDNSLALELQRAKDSAIPLSLIMVDVDQFKQFNDNNGHDAGDECLKQISKLLTMICCRNADIAARYGGEEFTLLLPDTNISGARIVANRLLQSFADAAYPHQHSNVAPYVTISGGLVQWDEKQNISELMKAADILLYDAKNRGRNQIVDVESKNLYLTSQSL